jgi:membrane associated rhomboid family serine protease
VDKVQSEHKDVAAHDVFQSLSEVSSYFSGRLPSVKDRRVVHGPVLSEVTSCSFDPVQLRSQQDTSTEQATVPQGGEEANDENTTVHHAPRKTNSCSEHLKSFSSSRELDSGRFLHANSTSEDVWSGSDDEGIILVKQRVAYLCIVLTALQLGILFIQLTLCGFASLDINPMIGPFPDAFSEWGGKNTYLLVTGHQYFRIITPVLLHVGAIHLLINAYCQLETCAYFEREWGSCRWLTIYLISGVGSVLTSSVVDRDTISVGSSGVLMGMFGAKIAQTVSWTVFELKNSLLQQSSRFDQLGGVMCSAAIISLLSFFTYIDWSGHLGGLFSGFLAGMVLFSKPIASRGARAIWATTGLLGLIVGATVLTNLLVHIEADEELGDACQYFRSLYPEGYNCECVWD